MKTWEKFIRPEDAGLSSKGLLEYLEQVEKNGVELHSVKILRHGKLVMTANYSPFDDRTPHLLFSLSKSFCSAAAGFCVQEGLLKWDTKVMDILPEEMPENPSEWLQSVTLHHLLCMGSGMKPESDEGRAETGWAKETLRYDCDYAPGTHFHYNSHGTYLVSCMVQKVTGQTVRDYLIPRLFLPLGIPVPFWQFSPEKVNVGGWGLYLSSDSIARFGQCLLQKGVWEGKQVLPLEWLERATVAQIDNSNGEKDPENEWHQGYGYQFWRTRGNRFRGDGAFGQLCMVSPDLDMVAAVTAGVQDMGLEMRLMHEYLFPAAEMAPGTEEEQKALQEKLASLSVNWPKDDGTKADVGGVYTCDQFTLYLKEGEDVLSIRLKNHEFEQEILAGKNKLLTFALPQMNPGDIAVVCQAKYGWEEGKLHLMARSINGPMRLDAVASFRDGKMEIDANQSLAFLQGTVTLEKQ